MNTRILFFGFFGLFSTQLLSGCVSSGSDTPATAALRVLETMNGERSTTALSVLGPPASVSQLGVNKQYLWQNNQGVINENSDYVKESRAASCRVEIIVDENDTILDSRMEGHYSACRKFIASLNKYSENETS